MFDFESKETASFSAKKLLADRLTAIGVLEGLNACALLESAYYETGRGRYSILVLDEAFRLYEKSGVRYLKKKGEEASELSGDYRDFLDALKAIQRRAPKAEEFYEFPIPLGGTGFLGYEFFGDVEDIDFQNEDELKIYDNAFIFGRNFLIFDYLHDEVLIVSVKYAGEITEVDTAGEVARIEKELKEFKPHPLGEKMTGAGKIVSPDNSKDYMNTVKIIKEEIYKGNLLQCVPSRRLKIESDLTPLEAYRSLRTKNPSPYLFYLDFGDFVIFGASPEVMVKVKDGKATVRPIAGTRPRGKTAGEDHELELDLLSDEKELAEHLMLIDLARNDLGRVAKPGSVVLSEKMIVERYSRVMHIVSETVADLADGKDSMDAIRATFPAGTLTGAAKIQAVKTIEKLEKVRRGVYGGLVGYFEADGSIDTCIAIRTAVFKKGHYYVQAGGGIVFDSVPETELEETNIKMKALLLALNIEVGE